MRISYAFGCLVAVAFLIGLNSRGLSQIEVEPRKIADIGLITNEHCRALIDSSVQEIVRKKTGERLYIFNYGPYSQLDRMERLTREYVLLGRYEPAIVQVIRAGSISPIRTVMWIVPKGSNPPKPEPEAYVLDQFGLIGRTGLERRITKFHQELNKSGSQGYIINYGTPRQIALAEKWITNVRRTGCHWDCTRITLVRGGPIRKRSTVVWIVPEGAENPVP